MAKGKRRRRLEGKGDGRPGQAQARHRDPAAGGGAFDPYHFTVTVSPGGAVAAGTVGTDEDANELEHVVEELPILAHRGARIVPWIGGPRFESMNSAFGRFGREGLAECQRWRYQLVVMLGMRQPATHEAPVANCECGWYALPLGLDHPMLEQPHVDLLVELSGRVIEHEHGYRAQHQRVIEVRMPGCELCGDPTKDVRLDPWATRCRIHPPAEPHDWVKVEDLSRGLGVPIVAGDRPHA